MKIKLPILIALVAFAATACSSDESSSISVSTELISDPAVLAGQMSGEWIVELVDSVDPSIEGKELLLRVSSGNGGSSLSLGFEECSHFGGLAESLSPFAATSATVQGVGDCEAEDSVAVSVLRRLSEARFALLDSGDAVLKNSDLNLSLSRR